MRMKDGMGFRSLRGRRALGLVFQEANQLPRSLSKVVSSKTACRSRVAGNGTSTMPPSVASGPVVIIATRSERNSALVDVVGHHQRGPLGSCAELGRARPAARARVSESSMPKGSSSSSIFGERERAREADALTHPLGELGGLLVRAQSPRPTSSGSAPRAPLLRRRERLG